MGSNNGFLTGPYEVFAGVGLSKGLLLVDFGSARACEGLHNRLHRLAGVLKCR